jgi:Regulator of chromosome condensation (RCC1) repeat
MRGLLVLVLVGCGARTELGVLSEPDAALPVYDAYVPPKEEASVPETSVPDVMDAAEEPDAPGPPPFPVVSVGLAHACAVSTAGAVKCWGSNGFGQLGDGTFDDSTTAVQVVGLESGALSVGVGEEFSCAMMQAGGMRCWGSNVYSQLDDISGGGGVQDAPVVAKDFSGQVLQVTGAQTFACAVTASDTAECWGWGLGGGWNTPKNPGFDPAVSIAVTDGPSVIVATTSGEVECWKVGVVYAADCKSPKGTNLGIAPGVVQVTTGGCYLLGTGDIQCPPTATMHPTSPATQVADGCATLQNGQVVCVENGVLTDESGGITDAVGISSGFTLCVARQSGTVECGEAGSYAPVAGFP